jgi:MATE family multidrug resistance protein
MIAIRPHAPLGALFDLAAIRRSRARVQFTRVGQEVRQLVRIASPIAAIGVMNMLLALTDVIMIGRLDPTGLAAIVIVSDFYSILFNFTVGFSAIVAPAAAAAIGAGVSWRVCTIVQRVTLLVCILAAAAATAVWFTPDILRRSGLRLDAPDTTGAYAHYMAGAFVLLVLFAMARHVLSATGRSRFAVLAIAAALPVNAILNHVFMAGAFGIEGIGAAGAGLASLVVALGLGGSAAAYLFLSRSFDGFRAPPYTERVLAPRELLRLARPAALMGLGAVAETGVFLLSTMVVGLIAPGMLVAHTLAFRAMGACYLLLAGIGQAATIRVAYLSRRGMPLLEAYACTAIISCGAALISLLVLAFGAAPRQIAGLMALTIGSDDPALLAETMRLVPLAGLALAAAVPAHIICATLKAQGKALAALALLAVGHWGVGLTTMLACSWADFGATGVWVALTLGALAASLAGVFWRCMHSGRESSNAVRHGRSLHLSGVPLPRDALPGRRSVVS